MRASARLGWRVATVVVFGATAALAVIVSRGAPLHTSLIAAKGGDGGHVAASANQPPAAAPQCAISRLRLSVGPGVRVAAQITRALPASSAAPVSTPPAAKHGGAVVAALIRYRLDFTNVSRLPCTMTGFPQVAADRNGVLVGGTAAHDTTVVAQRLLLAPGQTVHASLDATVPTARCHPVRASGLRVTPPGQTSARYLNRPLTTCTARGQIYLHVRAVQAGADDPAGDPGAPAGGPAGTAASSPAAGG